jgi:hypothetical protein
MTSLRYHHHPSRHEAVRHTKSKNANMLHDVLVRVQESKWGIPGNP